MALWSASFATPQTQFFSEKHAFLGAAGAQHIESFETLPVPQVCTAAAFVLPGVTIIGTAGLGADNRNNENNNGIHATDGIQYLKLGDCQQDSETVVFTFACATWTFGIYVVDFGEIAASESGSIRLITNSGVDHVFETVPPQNTNGNEIFIGIVGGDAFTEARVIKTTSVGDGVNLDELYFTTTGVSGPPPESSCTGGHRRIPRRRNWVGASKLPMADRAAPPGSGNWNDLADGSVNGSAALASGSATSTLVISNCQPAAAARYRCVVSDACAIVFGDPATLSVCDAAADLDCDGDVDLPDLAVLLSNFGRTDSPSLAEGNIDGDTDVDVQDLAYVLADFGIPCP